MQLSSRYIDPGPNPKRLLLNLPIIESSIVLGIRNCKGTLSNKMRRQAGVSMRRVICIAAIGPGEDMSETPVSGETFALAAGSDGVSLCFCHSHIYSFVKRGVKSVIRVK